MDLSWEWVALILGLATLMAVVLLYRWHFRGNRADDEQARWTQEHRSEEARRNRAEHD